MKVLRLSLSTLLVILAVNVGSAQDFALGGALVTPDKVIPHAWLVIKGGQIDSIATQKPQNRTLRIVETEGIIFPGFVDLHNHPMYNAFARWRPAGRFRNRYEWRDLQQYKDLVGTPGGELQLKDDQTFCDLDEYAEVRALIGGTTSISGISGRRNVNPPVPNCLTGLVRNLDWASGFYGPTTGAERVRNALGVTPRDMRPADAAQFASDIQNQKIDLLLIHVAEGAPLDMESTTEFLALKGWNLLTKHTAIIHGTAFSGDDFAQMKDAGAALVWSPRSNIELYGVTTDVATAQKQGVTIALAPDWSPTGSTNMLAEISYASRLSQENLAGLLSDQRLFEMATIIPARIASLDRKIGSLQPGLYADLFVLRGDAARPFTALAHANPADIQLVLIGGIAAYGTHSLMQQFAVTSETVDVCGSPMELNSAALPAGRFGDVTKRLSADFQKYKLGLAPLADCAP